MNSTSRRSIASRAPSGGMLTGLAASSGTARGAAFVCACGDSLAVPRRAVAAVDVASELERLDAAVGEVESELLRNAHLRSTRAVTGYQVHALDGAIGHVSDFVLDDRTWAIRQVVVQTGHWYARKRVRISPRDIERISFDRSAIFVVLTQDDFKEVAENTLVAAHHPQALGIEE